ncbi:hypothetical protein ACFY04_00770 [Streptomyces sp. NPDC001549]|uniref:hypothetical protein n=1 Tax=Streptomyces sp. NPDC001549 TaxID=3364586 RepID=UPI00369099E7
MALTAARLKAMAGPIVAPGPGQVSPIRVLVSSCRGERELAMLGPAVPACVRAVRRELYGPGPGPGRAAAARPQDPRPAVSEQEMDNMLGWLRFSEWM